MKAEKNILIAFVLNLSFSIFEFFGGLLTGSASITADAIHDLGDAVSIGLSYFFEKISKKQPDNTYTYGYKRYSIIGSLVTTFVLIFSSLLMIVHSIVKILNPNEINYNGMIVLAIIGFFINLLAAYITSGKDSLNQKAVNLHMLEDVLGWLIVLLGAIVMKFTDFILIDPIMSIFIAVFIFYHSFDNLKEIFDIFLEKAPKDIDMNQIKESLLKIDGILNIHHMHIWNIDEETSCATLHVVVKEQNNNIKMNIKEKIKEYGITHTTVEMELENEKLKEYECEISNASLIKNKHHHGHHHGHHH